MWIKHRWSDSLGTIFGANFFWFWNLKFLTNVISACGGVILPLNLFWLLVLLYIEFVRRCLSLIELQFFDTCWCRKSCGDGVKDWTKQQAARRWSWTASSVVVIVASRCHFQLLHATWAWRRVSVVVAVTQGDTFIGGRSLWYVDQGIKNVQIIGIILPAYCSPRWYITCYPPFSPHSPAHRNPSKLCPWICRFSSAVLPDNSHNFLAPRCAGPWKFCCQGRY